MSTAGSETTIIAREGPTDSDLRQQLLAAAADPVRLRVLSELRRPLSVGELCDRLEMAQPRVSHHLAVLRDCGLVGVEVQGRKRVHRWASPNPGSPQRDLQELLLKWLGTTESGPRPVGISPPAPAVSSRPASTELDDFLL